MRQNIAILLNNIAKKSSNLIGNFTSNLAESWMHMWTKFDGGKMYNHCYRGSWHTRCYGAALRNNLSPLWSPKVWESSTQSTSGHYLKKLFNTRERNININNTSKSKPEIKQNRWKREMKASKEAKSRKAIRQYGKECIQADCMRSSKQKFVGRHILHGWFDEETNSNEWYKGVVITVLKKLDGDDDAVYEVLNEGFDDSYEIDHLAEDFGNSSMKFIDI
ncbi:unnamed protein product [Mytilus coruscus]|uniref:Uncharacterized protein n=1 Tax=Mytilus coruscus TaxID=42192 RepID=A0A6J8C777_MYTCO|nr:unnamed protein product [Mytilus coruscus]